MQTVPFLVERNGVGAGMRSKISVYLFAVYRERVNRYDNDYV